MTAAAAKLAEVAKAAGWTVARRDVTGVKSTFTTEEAPEDSKAKATRTKGDDVEVPVVVLRLDRGTQRVYASWRDGKFAGATAAHPLRGLGSTELRTYITESHTWPCRWLPAGRNHEICEAHGEVRDAW